MSQTQENSLFYVVATSKDGVPMAIVAEARSKERAESYRKMFIQQARTQGATCRAVVIPRV